MLTKFVTLHYILNSRWLNKLCCHKYSFSYNYCLDIHDALATVIHPAVLLLNKCSESLPHNLMQETETWGKASYRQNKLFCFLISSCSILLLSQFNIDTVSRTNLPSLQTQVKHGKWVSTQIKRSLQVVYILCWFWLGLS